MRLKKEEVKKIAELTVKNLKGHSLITTKVADEKIHERIELVIHKNLDEEAAIEEEVKRIMEQYRTQIASSQDGAIDPQKAYMMIKKQVAKDRKFVL